MLTKNELKQLRLRAVQAAREQGLKVRAAGDGLFRLEGQDQLLCASQILALLWK